MGGGRSPCLMVIDATLGYFGGNPEPIEQSMMTWRHSCGMAAWNALPYIEKLLGECRALGIPVIYSAQASGGAPVESGMFALKNARSGEGSGPPVSSGASGLDPRAIHPVIAPIEGEIVIRKRGASVFYGTPLIMYLNRLGVDTLVVTGCVTSGCVRASVVDAFQNGYRSLVVTDATFDRFEASHAIALFDIHCKYGDVISCEEAIQYLRQSLRTSSDRRPQG